MPVRCIPRLHALLLLGGGSMDCLKEININFLEYAYLKYSFIKKKGSKKLEAI